MAQGKRSGRPTTLTPEQRQDVRNRIEDGDTISAIAREMKTSWQTIIRARDARTYSDSQENGR